MMWDWPGHISGWWWAMVPVMLAFWALVSWGIVLVVRASDRTDRAKNADHVLAERCARGETGEVECLHRGELLRG